MRGTTAKRIHTLAREGGPRMSWRGARDLWRRMIRSTGVTTAKLAPAPRRRKTSFKGMNPNSQRPHSRFVHTVRQFYGHLKVIGVCQGHRKNRGQGPKAMRLKEAEMQRLQLAMQLGLQAVRKQAAHKKAITV